MKHYRTYESIAVLLATVIMIVGFTTPGIAQEDKIKPRVDLTYFQAGEEAPYIIVRVRKRVDRRYYPISGIPVGIFFNEESDESKMGEVVTNVKGEGKVVLPEGLKASWEDMPEFEFIAVVAPSDTTEEISESIFVKRARLQLTAEGMGEDRVIRVIAEEKSAEGWVPLEDVEVKVFVKRHFGNLVVGEDSHTSDAEGAMEVEFNDQLPGDEKGMIVLGGMIEEHEEYGSVIAYTSINWGIPLEDSADFMERSLWATRDRAPWWLLIFPNLIIAGVWGVIGYLVVQIVRIKKLAKR